MATLFPFGIKITDANDDPLSGAKVRVYEANTTTLADLFGNAALSSAIPNPVITNADGYPTSDGSNETLIYIAAGTYDVAILSSADEVLYSWDDVVPWGSDSGDIDRTVSGSGRIKITGSAGAVLIQAGDPDPDDSGGTLTIEGWAGSQLDTLTLDAAAVNAGTTAGALTENGKDLSGVVATPSTSFAAAATIDIALPNEPDGARAWRIDVFDLFRSAGTAIDITLRLSFDGGSTFKSTNEYTYWVFYRDQSATSATDQEAVGAAGIPVAKNSNGKSNYPMWGVIEIITPLAAGSSEATIVRGDFCGINQETPDPYPVRSMSVGYCQSASQGPATHARLVASAGNINGNYRVTPMRGFGE